LAEGEAYYIEVEHIEWNGGADHVSIAVEIENNTIDGHHH
jgi:hypothetical protein